MNKKPYRYLMLLVFQLVCAAPVVAQSQDKFVPTGHMNFGRAGHTATLLPNGKVLIVGGRGTSGDFPATAELYDPVSGRFELTGTMIWPRQSHTATLLPDGKVLIVGGGQATLLNAEIYDPSTGNFSLTPEMAFARRGHTATFLRNGKVLIAGGGPTVCELYDPATGTFTRTGSTTIASVLTASLLHDGRVLVVGNSSELYDPETGMFSRTGSIPTPASVGSTATVLVNGDVLVTGGADDEPVYDRAALYVPANGSFMLTGSMSTGRASHTATLLPNGTVLISGGSSYPCSAAGCAVTFRRSAEVYDPATRTFIPTDNMAYARWNHAATLLNNGQVLITGGILPGTITGQASAELYAPRSEISPVAINANIDPANVRLGGSFTATFSGLNVTNETYFDVRFRGPEDISEQEALNWQRGESATHEVPIGTATGVWVIIAIRAHQDRDDHNLDYFPVSSYVTVSSLVVTDMRLDPSSVRARESFTVTFSGTNLNSETYFDVRFRSPGIDTDQFALNWQRGESATHEVPIGTATGVWTITGVWPHQRVNDHSTDFMPTFSNFAVATSPSHGSFFRTGDMRVARTNHTATLLPNGKVLIAGGGTGPQPGSYLASAELYDPTTGTFTVTGSMSPPRASHSATLLPNGKVLIAGGRVPGNPVTAAELYDPDTETFVPTGQMVMPRLHHTATLVSDGKVLIAGGPTRAELYDPATGTFELAAPPTISGHPLLGGMVIPSATVLADGRVLLSGPSSETYDPMSGRFTRAGNLVFPSFGHSATLLPLGKVLIAGGIWEDEGPLARAELYDPATRTFASNGNMTTNRNQHTATLLNNGAVLLTGGEDGTCSFVPPPCSGATLSSYELYDPITGTFVAGGTMVAARQGHTATVLNDGRVLLTGGTNATAELYDDRSR